MTWGTVLGLGLLLALIAWSLGGPAAVIWTVVLGMAFLIFAPEIQPRFVLRWMGARELVGPGHELNRIATELARRAELEVVPRIYWLPSPEPNAFTIGKRDQAAVASARTCPRRGSPKRRATSLRRSQRPACTTRSPGGARSERRGSTVTMSRRYA